TYSWQRIFFFQAEDGIRDGHVTGVQTCAPPIYHFPSFRDGALAPDPESRDSGFCALHRPGMTANGSRENKTWLRRSSTSLSMARSEERRVRKECGCGWVACHSKKKRKARREIQR